MAFTKVTDPVDNITNQPNQPIIGATALKALFDEIGKDLKAYINDTLIEELESTTDGDSGLDNIGMTPINGVMTTPQQSFEYLKSRIDANSPTLNIISVLDYGAKGDGVTDDTESLKSAFDLSGNIYIPDGVYMVDPSNNIMLKSNTKITFGKNAIIKNLPHNLESYQMLKINDVENVEIINPKLDGSRSDNTSITGELGHGISMRGSTNIIIDNAEIKNCWGDGIYIGSTATQNYCKNVFINKAVLDNNRRQGLSLVSAKTARLNDINATNTNGTNPQTGIDIEPNANTDFIEDITINDLYTYNNSGGGLKMYFNALIGTTEEVSVTVNGHYDKGSVSPLIIESTGALPMNGVININNPVYIESSRESIKIKKQSNQPHVNIFQPKLINPCVNGATSSTFDNGIGIYYNSETTYADLGGVTIIRPDIKDDRVSPKMVRPIYVANQTGTLQSSNINILDIEYLDNNLDSSNTILNYNVKNSKISDPKDLLKSYVNGSFTISGSTYFKTYSSRDFTSSRTLTLSSDLEIGMEITFVSEKATAYITVQPPILESISPLGAVGKYVRSLSIGSSLTIKKINATHWYVTNITGTWEVQA